MPIKFVSEVSGMRQRHNLSNSRAYCAGQTLHQCDFLRVEATDLLKRIMTCLPARRNEVVLSIAAYAARVPDEPFSLHEVKHIPPCICPYISSVHVKNPDHSSHHRQGGIDLISDICQKISQLPASYRLCFAYSGGWEHDKQNVQCHGFPWLHASFCKHLSQWVLSEKRQMYSYWKQCCATQTQARFDWAVTSNNTMLWLQSLLAQRHRIVFMSWSFSWAAFLNG